MKWVARQKFFRLVPDKLALKILYKNVFYKKLNLKNPQTFNEKLQWLKLYNRNPLYTTLVDKYAVKEYVANIIGEEHIIPTLGVWEKFDDIDFDVLPDKFVLKCTHSSGDIVICKDKNAFDKAAAKKKLENFLKKDIYKIGREWPYKNVPRKIIAEKYMEDEIYHELRDYKFFCFDGVCKCFKVDFDRFIKHRANYYDKEKKLLPFGEKAYLPDIEKKIELNQNIDEMIGLSEKLAKNFSFLRVDFYNVNGKIYFGELTFYPTSGFGKFTDENGDRLLGDWITLPKKRK